MLLDVRVYKLHVGGREAFHALVRDETVPMARRYGHQVVDFGPSAHDDESYYLLRAFISSDERAQALANLYGSDEWRTDYDARVMALIESYQVAVIPTSPEVVTGLNAAGEANVIQRQATVTSEGDESIVAALDTEYQTAVERNDADTMDRILADDFVLITGLGRIYTKADLLNEARSKSTVYAHQKDTEQRVRVWGDTAVVTALLSASGSTNGESFEYQLWFSDTYVRTPTGWRYVLGQASTRMPAGRANASR